MECRMSKLGEGISNFVADSIVLAVGWAFCLAMLIGFYGLGYLAAPYVAGEEHRDSVAMLSALVLVWLYEHRRAETRWEHLNDRISKLNEQILEQKNHY